MKTSDPNGCTETEKKLLDVARGLYIEAQQFKASPEIAFSLRREADGIYQQYGTTHEEVTEPVVAKEPEMTEDEINEDMRLRSVMRSILETNNEAQVEEKPQGFFRSMINF